MKNAILKKGMSLLAVLALTNTTAFAASPEFARSADEWTRLKDDVLEYDEIPDLVHEYNATVQKNAIDLNEFKKDYGETNMEWADRYRELADELESELYYPDVDDSSYATVMTSVVTSEMQIETWRELADDAVDDYLTYYYTYQSAEAALAKSAQLYRTAYEKDLIAVETDRENIADLERKLDIAKVKEGLGQATRVEVLTASQSVNSARQALEDDTSAAALAKKSLIVLTGWKADADPQIADLPQLDLSHIDSMDPSADADTAIENSYTLKINRRKLENAAASDTREELQETIAENTENIRVSIQNAYDTVTSARLAWELAEANAELAKENLEAGGRSLAQGLISSTEYADIEYAASTADASVQSAYIDLFDAVLAYDWAVNGLADAS